MEIKSSFYQDHISDRCMEIPTGALLEVIDEFSQNAKFYMSSDIDAPTTEKINATVVDLLRNYKYKYLPLYLVGEAFIKGSLGELGGTTRFTVRNVCIWLNQMTERLHQINAERKTKEDAERRMSSENNFRQHKDKSILYGKALCLKLTWVYGCAITSDNWNNYTLDAIVNQFRAGETEKTLKPSMISK